MPTTLREAIFAEMWTRLQAAHAWTFARRNFAGKVSTESDLPTLIMFDGPPAERIGGTTCARQMEAIVQFLVKDDTSEALGVTVSDVLASIEIKLQGDDPSLGGLVWEVDFANDAFSFEVASDNERVIGDVIFVLVVRFDQPFGEPYVN